MENDLQYEFLAKRYKSVDDLLELEKRISDSETDVSCKITAQNALSEIQKHFTLIDVFYDNLSKLSLQDKAEFILRHKKVNITKIMYTFDLDWQTSKRIFQYLKLCNVGKFENSYLKITEPEEFKSRLVNQVQKVLWG